MGGCPLEIKQLEKLLLIWRAILLNRKNWNPVCIIPPVNNLVRHSFQWKELDPIWIIPPVNNLVRHCVNRKNWDPVCVIPPVNTIVSPFVNRKN